LSKIIEDAIAFAAIKHHGQYRKSTNTPYITHPVGVGLILKEAKLADEVVVAGILHDTLEDTDTTEDEIRQKFGENVLSLVIASSEPDKAATWESRKLHTINSLKQKSLEELSVILADKLHNLRTIKEDLNINGEEVWDRFSRSKREQSWYYMNILQEVLIKKKEIPFMRQFEETACLVFVGVKKLNDRLVDLLMSKPYELNYHVNSEFEKYNVGSFMKEVYESSNCLYQSGDYEKIEPLYNYFEERGVKFQSNSDGPIILMSFMYELQYRLGWSDEQLYTYFNRKRQR